MNIIDFMTGLTLSNTIPHFVLGISKGRMFCAWVSETLRIYFTGY